LSWTAVLDEGRVYAVARDVTDLKNAEEQLRASRHELAQVSRQTTMGAMTASIAHEVNQPWPLSSQTPTPVCDGSQEASLI
jgi:C4-dicarboxylate-specific signal transduction histidine kinase